MKTWLCLQEMVAPNNSTRGPEKFVQWKEPMRTRGQSTTRGGHAPTSTGRKNMQQRGDQFPGGEAHALSQGAEAENYTDSRSASATELEGGGGPSSPGAAEIPSGTPPPRFRPPRQVGNAGGDNVQLQRSPVSERAPTTHHSWYISASGACRPQQMLLRSYVSQDMFQVSDPQQSIPGLHQQVCRA